MQSMSFHFEKSVHARTISTVGNISLLPSWVHIQILMQYSNIIFTLQIICWQQVKAYLLLICNSTKTTCFLHHGCCIIYVTSSILCCVFLSITWERLFGLAMKVCPLYLKHGYWIFWMCITMQMSNKVGYATSLDCKQG